MQTGKSTLAPVVLLDPEGSNYWDRWNDFVIAELLEAKLISPADMDLFTITSSVEEAAAEICDFYSTYHSSRAVGQRLVLRLKRELSNDELDTLNAEFADIVEEGKIEHIATTDSEIRDDDHIDLHRIAFRFNRHGYARLRMMIDVINGTSS